MPDFPLYTCSFLCGACSGPRPGQDPSSAWMGGVSVLYREGKTGSCPPTLPPPVLSRVRTYLAGPRARRGHHPGSSFQISGRVPRCPAAPPPAAPPPCRRAAGARLRPYSGPTNRAMPGTAAPNPRKSRRRSPAGPAPRAAAAFGPRSRAGRGRCARLGSLRGKTLHPHPAPHSSPGVEDSGLVVAWEGSNLNAVPSTHSGVEFPPTFFQAEKLRSKETSDCLQVTRNVGGMHSFSIYFNTRYEPRATLGPGTQW